MRYTKFLFLILLPYVANAQSTSIEQLKDSLLSTITTESPDTAKFDVYQQLVLGYKFQDLDSIAKYTQLAKESIAGSYYPLRQAQAIGYETYIAFMQGRYDESLDLADEVLATLEGLESEEAVALRRRTINDQGTMYAALGMYELGLRKFYELFEIYEQEGSINESYYVALSNIGVMYNRLKYFENALEIFLRLDKEMPAEYESRMSVPVNLGFIYYDLKEFEEAKFHLNQALALEGNIDPRVYGLSNFKLGQVYNAQEQHEQAIDAFNASINIFRDQKNELETVQSINGLAQAYLGLTQLQRAYEYGLEGLEIADRYNAIPERKAILESLYLITKEQGNFEEALDYHEQFKEISDFITTSETTSEIERLTAEYEYQKKEEQLIAETRQRELISQAKIE
ncbi:MAG: tetratricopeptide repeat protein, partial [Balneolales bacterium]|nr:tetratricopeptide repeat protein [Balneolales bacterium]